MNYYISILFRAIPIIMASICLALGLLILSSGRTIGDFVAGHVTTFLAAICICLFCTACVIILQLIGKFRPRHCWIYPILGYLVAITTFSYGVHLFKAENLPQYFVAGHVIAGLGLICVCISTVALASTKFTYIPKHSNLPMGAPFKGPRPFSRSVVGILFSIPIAMALIGWIWAFILLSTESQAPHFIAGHVMGGLAAICTSLISLLWSVLRQIQNTHGDKERFLWPGIVVVMGILCLCWGLVLVILHDDLDVWYPPGFVLIGLGLICFSILSKVLLLSLVWKRICLLANRVPLLPVTTALSCLFLAAFLFQISVNKPFAFIPARVLVGLGAICFSLFSIVSILESGTSKSKR